MPSSQVYEEKCVDCHLAVSHCSHTKTRISERRFADEWGYKRAAQRAAGIFERLAEELDYAARGAANETSLRKTLKKVSDELMKSAVSVLKYER